MASVIEPTEESLVCGYCLQTGDQVIDPRVLPCQHLHCYACLVGAFETNRIVRCGSCKEVFDVTLSRLPSTKRHEQQSAVCSSCSEKEITDEPAAGYCFECNRKFCNRHLEMHEDFYPMHKKILNIEDYRSCRRHENKAVTTGCSACLQVLCATCVDVPTDCGDGVAHSSVSLEELVNLLKTKRDKVKSEAQVKEGELSTLLKESIKVLSDHERKTGEMIEQLHRTRDEQLSELRRKYDELEEGLVESRKRSKEQLTKFIEREVGSRITEINTLLLLQDAQFRDSNQVDLVRNFTDTVKELKRFVDDVSPSLTLSNQKVLSSQGALREIELRLVDAADVSIGRLSPPTSLNLKRVVDNVGECYSVSHNGGGTYVGGRLASLCRVDESDWSVANLSSIEGIRTINGLHVYKDNLYILAYPWRVIVTDLNGKQITSWAHSDSEKSVNKLVITGERVIVSDRSNKQLAVYSLNGQVIKRIYCPHAGRIAVCAPDRESVVVSSYGTSTVFRVNIETGEVMWTSTAVTKPGGVACYGQEYILVTPLTSTQTEIHLLDATTGKQVGKLIDPEKRTSSSFYDLCVTGNTLIVPRRDQNVLLYYQLISG